MSRPKIGSLFRCPGCERDNMRVAARGLCRGCYNRVWIAEKRISDPMYGLKRRLAVRKVALKRGPVYRFNRSLIYKYGITYDDYMEMLRNQLWRCAGCRTIEPGHGRLFFCVDHDHITEKVRGLLCQDCNLALGKLKDNVETLLRLTDYLRENSDGVSLRAVG